MIPPYTGTVALALMMAGLGFSCVSLLQIRRSRKTTDATLRDLHKALANDLSWGSAMCMFGASLTYIMAFAIYGGA